MLSITVGPPVLDTCCDAVHMLEAVSPLLTTATVRSWLYTSVLGGQHS